MKTPEQYKKLLQVTLSQVKMFNDDLSCSTINDDGRRTSERMRDAAILQAVLQAQNLGYSAGLTIHTPLSDMQAILTGGDRNCVEAPARVPKERGIIAYIELPRGQINWSLYTIPVKIDKQAYKHQNEILTNFIQEGRRKASPYADDEGDDYYE